ncbi:MAG: GDSL-type esterase/lipase family protein [Lachnospiraceae bacterium]|nr:GDSL-type esterase/lipase family protein [Lachnospiraceae bacterium]
MSKYIGDVSAYAYAVSKGYTGTEEEFAELMASYADVGQRAEDAANSAMESKTSAQTAATTATNKASEATTAATTATNKASEAQTSAQTASSKASEASQSASQASGYAQTAETAKTDAQTAKTQADTARDEAVTAKTAAETAQGKAEDAQAAAESVAESIPSDYSQLSDDVSDLKEDLSETTYNLFNDEVTNQWITSTGGIATGMGYALSDFISIEPATIYTIVSNNGLNGMQISFWDSNRTFISRNNQLGTLTKLSETAPTNAVFMRVGFYSLDIQNRHAGGGLAFNSEDCKTLELMAYKGNADLEYLPNITAVDAVIRNELRALQNEVYAGKKFSILGDSISTFAGTGADSASDGHLISSGEYTYTGNHCRYPNSYLSDVNDTYWMKLINALGMTLGVNDSWAGSMVSWNGGSAGDIGADIYVASPTRIGHLDDNGTPDIILVNAGTNDIGRSVTIGTFNTESPVNYTDEEISNLPVATFADAYRAMLIRLQKSYPLARIIVMLPNYTTTYYNPMNADAYLEVIKEECDYFGIPWVDMRTTGITMFNVGTYTGDGIHPNIKGMTLLYEKVRKAFLYSV